MALTNARRRLGWLLLVVVLGLPGGAAAQSAADELTATAVYAFGQMMQFELRGETAVAYDSATLFFQSSQFETAFRIDVPLPTATRTVDLTQTVDFPLAGASLPPFATVEYWWELRGADGELLSLPRQSFVYADDRFAWQAFAADNVVIHWTDAANAALGADVLPIVSQSVSRLTPLLPRSVDDALQIYVYPSSADLRAALRLTGLDWEREHVDPALGVVMVTAVNARTAAQDLRQRLPHEIAHLLLYRATNGRFLPAWLSEGVATRTELDVNPTYAPLLETAVAANTIIPPAALCAERPDGSWPPALLYAQSASLVDFVERRYGYEAIPRLLAAHAAGATCETAVAEVLKTTPDDLVAAWAQSEGGETAVMRLLTDYGWLLLLWLGSFVISGLLAWRI